VREVVEHVIHGDRTYQPRNAPPSSNTRVTANQRRSRLETIRYNRRQRAYEPGMPMEIEEWGIEMLDES